MYSYNKGDVRVATSVRLSEEFEERLDNLAQKTNRTKAYYIRKALEENLERYEYEYGILQDLEEYRKGTIQGKSLDDLDKELDFV